MRIALLTPLLMVPLANCASNRSLLASDPSFRPQARELAVDVCVMHKPSAPFRIVGTLRVEADQGTEVVEIQRLALLEAARVGCELVIAPQLIATALAPPAPFVLTHGGDDHPGPSSGAGPGPGAGPTSGPTQGPSDARGSSNSGGVSVHEFGCGVYLNERKTDA